VGLFFYVPINISMIDNIEKFNNTVCDFTQPQQYTAWLLELGKNLPVKDRAKLCVRENFVRGCQDDVWITVNFDNNQCAVQCDSSANTMRGVLSIIKSVVTNCTKDQVLALQYNDFKPIFRYLPAIRQRGIQIILNKIQSHCG
jgi:sulfur transfer protein SufE